MRPIVHPVKPLRMMWLDFKTGKGVDSDGRSVMPIIRGRRKTPTLADLLDTAANGNADWIMATGTVPKLEDDKPHYFAVETPGWRHGQHWLDDEPTGRYQNELTGQKVEISLARSWFGDLPLTPSQTREAWNGVRYFLNRADKQMVTPLKSPGATGAYLWAYGLNRNFDPEPVEGFIAEQIHATSGQHHIDFLVSGPNVSKHPDVIPLIDPKKTPTIETFAHSDGRFMYASLCKELGVGPARELRRQEAADLLRDNPYAKARYRVKFTVPDTWQHVGILGVQSPEDRESWYYPNRPGATGETWADATEIHLAGKYGWGIDPLEAVQFTEKARPLDTFAERITRVREQVESSQNVDPILVKAVTAALRNVLLHGIGRFASRGRLTMYTVDRIDDVPLDSRDTMREVGDKIAYRRRAEMSKQQLSFYHPELAAQVWGFGRARVLESPSALGRATAGALHVDPRTLMAIEGDAIYTTETPAWSLPTAYGGGDDGQAGRIRLQGLITGTMKTPTSKRQRDIYKKRAAAAGPDAAFTNKEG